MGRITIFAKLHSWIDSTVVDLVRQFRWSFLPPLLVYFAAGISALTAIVGTFYVKEHLGFPASFLTGLAFWAGIPWTLKVPLGHIVDLVWRWKSALIFLGAALITLSVAIMYGLIAHPARMAAFMGIEIWYVVSVLLAPVGYVLQDVVADAMTVEAVPTVDKHGQSYSEQAIKAMHTTMQTLGRVAIISGLVAVALLNIWMFAGVSDMSEDAKTIVYGRIYLAALAIPAISVSGVVLSGIARRSRAAEWLSQGVDPKRIREMMFSPHDEHVAPNWRIIGGGIMFAALVVATGIGSFRFNQEVVFAGSMAIVLFLMRELILQLPAEARRQLMGTAIIIFVFRSVPLPGPAATWWEIDVLGFDQQFLSLLTLITSCLALAGMLVLRPLMARRTIADVVIILSIASGVLSLPNVGLYYGLHEWTARHTAGIIDARAIAIMDTALESPLAQISMIPMLAWIAKNAPGHLKATFFAVMASFTNLALSASSLLTKYLNEIFVVEREVRDPSGDILVRADYGELGGLLISAAAITVILPVTAIAAVQLSSWRTRQ